jgi:hypothetical protein
MLECVLRVAAESILLDQDTPLMASFSLRLTHKIAAIGVVGVAGVILVGGIHMCALGSA